MQAAPPSCGRPRYGGPRREADGTTNTERHGIPSFAPARSSLPACIKLTDSAASSSPHHPTYAAVVRHPLGHQLWLLGRKAPPHPRRQQRRGRDDGGSGGGGRAGTEQPGACASATPTRFDPSFAMPRQRLTTHTCKRACAQVALSVLLRLKDDADTTSPSHGLDGGQSSPHPGQGKRQRRGEAPPAGPLELLVVNTHLKAAKTAEGEKVGGGGEGRSWG